eukprot:7692816-Pyramimonas_sp.AAC.2
MSVSSPTPSGADPFYLRGVSPGARRSRRIGEVLRSGGCPSTPRSRLRGIAHAASPCGPCTRSMGSCGPGHKIR